MTDGWCSGQLANTPTSKTPNYTPDELVVLNGISGFGDSGQIDTSKGMLAPGNKLGFSIKFTWEDHPGDPSYWAIRTGLPAGTPMHNIDTFSCELYVESNNGASLNIYLLEPADNRWVCWTKPLKEVETGKWLHIEVKRDQMRLWKLAVKKEEWDKIGGLGIEPNEGKAVFYLDNLRLKGTDGKVVEIMNADDDGFHALPNWHEPMAKIPPVGTVFYPFDSARLDDQALRNSPIGFNNLVGPVGTPMSGYSPGLVGISKNLRSHGIPTIYYGSFGSGYTRYFTKRLAWDMNAAGHTLNTMPGNLTGWDYQHTFADAHPAVVEAQRLRIDALLRAGISTWMVVDYTFPWMETLWGYSAVMQNAFRSDLLGNDEGLFIHDGEKERAIHFADYFRSYNGFEPKPQDAGWKSWREFVSLDLNDNSAYRAPRHVLFMYIRSYEWLKLADRTGRYYRSKGGNPLWIIPNPEDSSGSSDYVYMLRSAGVGNLFPEWFGCIGWAAEAGYASLPYLREQADRSGSRLSIIHETGAGGHSAPYLDWRITYNGIYALTAAGRMDNIDNDFMDEAYYTDMSDPAKNPYQFTRFRDGVIKALAFRQARAEKPQRPASSILCISERPPAHASGSIFFALNQPHTLAVGLSRAHFTFDLRDSLDLVRVIDRYRVLVYSAWNPRVGDIAIIRRWLATKPGRILITHSFVPTRDTREYRGMDAGTDLGKVNGGSMLGLGRITATTSTHCTITSAVDTWKRFFPQGQAIELPSPLTKCEKGETLVMTDAGPLVSRVIVGKGEVIYLHYTPSDSIPVQHVDVKVMQAMGNAVGIKPTCETDFDAPVQVFSVKGGSSVIAWDAPAMGKWTFKYEPGIAALAYEAPDVTHDVSLPASGSAPWIIYDFWSDKMENVQPAAGVITLHMKDTLTCLYYAGPDTPAFKATIAAAQKMRKKLSNMKFESGK